MELSIPIEYLTECPYCGHKVIKRIGGLTVIPQLQKCVCTFCTICHNEFNIILDPAKCLGCNRCNKIGNKTVLPYRR